MDGPEPKDWEHKYRVMQGKYHHEVPALRQENQQLKGDLQALRQQVDELVAQARQPVNQPPPVTPASTIKPEEVQQYGEDFVDFVKRVATSVAPPQIAPAKVDTSQLEARVARAENVSEAALKRQFFGDLTALSPRWEQQNTDKAFLTWLDETDPMTGMTRQAVFDDAYSKLDVNRVAAFFNTFGGSSVGAAPTGVPPANAMVTPMTMRGQPDVPQGKRLWTSKEIGDFFNNVRTGRITPEDAARVEQDIFAAQTEGRVR